MRQRLRWLPRPLRELFFKLIFSFPIHLLIYNLKKNQVFLLFWAALWAIVSGNLWKRYGASYLFLDPEYLDKVNVWSFMIVGMAFGGFIIAYNITCYILDAYRYTFLGTLKHPLLQFSLNNGIVPLLFGGYYLVKIFYFQLDYEQDTIGGALAKMFACLLGILLMFVFTSVYFRFTRKRLLRSLAESVDKKLKKGQLQRVNVMERLHNVQNERVIISSYYSFPLSMILVDNRLPYNREAITKVFDQTQLNAVIIQIVLLISLFLLGLFREVPFFQIPAAASMFLLLAIGLMITGAVAYWLRKWAITFVIGVSVLLRVLPLESRFDPYHKAFGMDYSEYATYSLGRVAKLTSAERFEQDKQKTLRILENWRAKFPKNKKPKVVFVASSGGGLRSALWTLKTLQYVDSTFNGKFMKQTMLITGSSGGLIGGAYFRELKLRELQNQLRSSIYSSIHQDKITLDKLNPTMFSLVVSDMLFRFQKFEISGQKYFKDRGYALERKLLLDMDSVLDKNITAYRDVEQEALIPMMIIAPSIVNDGRKLYISPQDISYMNVGHPNELNELGVKVRGIEFRRFFEQQQADSLRFITALRMNATFPYITPNVILPSEPGMAIMDAGLSDNFGFADALHFMFVFKDWIKENTDGAVLVAIRDRPKERELNMEQQKGKLDQVLAPINGLVQNIFSLQDINNDQKLEFMRALLDNKLDVINFRYLNADDIDQHQEASLSWRLTEKEKEDIINAIQSDYNTQSMQKLKNLLEGE